MDFENSEMKGQLLFKYFSQYSKLVKTPKVVIDQKAAQKQQPPKQQITVTYDFSKELEKLDRTFENNRLNKNPRNYVIAGHFYEKTVPKYLVGSHLSIAYVLANAAAHIDTEGSIVGWAKTVRSAENDTLLFIDINDGTCVGCLQVVVKKTDVDNFEDLLKCSTGTSFTVFGKFVKSPKDLQPLELTPNKVEIVGTCDPKDFPLAKKKHSLEFLREIAHLRPRTNTIGAVARVRNNLASATHMFYNLNGFQYIHTPLITASDCEGAGEMFQVTTILPEQKEKMDHIKKTKDRQVDYKYDFFKKPAFLTVSGQLSVETYCCALSNVYTFGPTFRAENSHTSRHLAEFWMIEPELAFADLWDVMDCAEAYTKFCLEYVLQNNRSDLEFLRLYKKDLVEYLQDLIKSPFGRCSYTDAIEILKTAIANGQVFENPVNWGIDLSSEHERFLAEFVFKRPVMLYNYPAKIKAFYMRLNEDNKTVACFDLLAPQIGELIGGSQREERLDVLKQRILDFNLVPQNYWWYNDLRRFGTVPHGGFGLGFERLVMMATGIENIRDVIPFPRYPGNAEF